LRTTTHAKITASPGRRWIEAYPAACLPPVERWNLVSAAVCRLIPVAVPTGDFVMVAVLKVAPATVAAPMADAGMVVVAMAEAATADVPEAAAAAVPSSTTAIASNTTDAPGSARPSTSRH
jgi:hypothetical protein